MKYRNLVHSAFMSHQNGPSGRFLGFCRGRLSVCVEQTWERCRRRRLWHHPRGFFCQVPSCFVLTGLSRLTPRLQHTKQISERSLTSTTKLCQDRKACSLIWQRSYNRAPALVVLFQRLHCVLHTEEVLPNSRHFLTLVIHLQPNGTGPAENRPIHAK